MPNKITIHTDGGARGNPGPSGIGAVLEYEDQHGHQKEGLKRYIGRATNNQAEYQAVVIALERAKELNPTAEVDVFLDSELVQQQLSGNYKVKNKELQPLFIRVHNLCLNFKKVKYIHIPRGENKEADRLVNEAIDEAGLDSVR